MRADQTTFHVMGFMASLKAARDFGLDPAAANEIALRFDPREADVDHLVDALAAALVDGGTLRVPDGP